MNGELIPYSVDEFFNNVVYELIFKYINNKEPNESEKQDYLINTYYSNVSILFFCLIKDDRRPNDLIWVQYHKNSLKCPLFYIPLFEKNEEIYYLPIELDINQEEFFKHCDRKINGKRVRSKVENLKLIEDKYYEYPFYWKQNEQVPQLIKKLLDSYSDKAVSPFPDAFKRAIFFLGFSLNVLKYTDGNTDEIISFQIKLLYAFMFFFFFDTIMESFLKDKVSILLSIFKNYIPGINRCFEHKQNDPNDKILNVINNVIYSADITEKERYFLRYFNRYFKDALSDFENNGKETIELLETSNLNELFQKRFLRSKAAYAEFVKNIEDKK